jgi:hypothetical protein
MVRSSVAAFYRLPRCVFYIVGGFHCGRFTIVFVRLPVRCEIKKIVHRMSEILFAAEIAFRRLHGYMPQQELNLLKLSAVHVAQLRTGSPQIMRGNMLQARSLAAALDYVQTGAGERIGDLPLVAKVARESTAKINYPTSRWRIENRFQTQSAFPRPLMPAPQPWRIALHAVCGTHFHHQVNESGFRNQESRNSHLTSMDNPLPFGCGSPGHDICGFV